MRQILFTGILVLMLVIRSLAQTEVITDEDKLERKGFALFNAFYAYQVPGKDLALRFGNNSMIGGGFLYKFNSNLVAGLEGGFIFSENIKNKDSYLSKISTSEGYVISEAGTFAEVYLHERGFNINAKLGGILPVIGPNSNSGILIMGGAGILQHKIRYEIPDNNAPQLSSEYKKGYDRLSNGPSISQFIGYVHFGNNRTINFHIGAEFIQAWTKSRRPFDFDRMQADTQKRFDLLWGIRVGWILPLYKRTAKEFYFY